MHSRNKVTDRWVFLYRWPGLRDANPGGTVTSGLHNERNIMKQIIIRMFVALTMCGVTSLIRLTSFVVISPTIQVHNEAIWISRIVLAPVLSPLLYGFLYRRTSTWAIRSKHQRQPSKDDFRRTSAERSRPLR